MKIWIACFAILMNALAPSISHALAASRGAAAGPDICRADTGQGIPSKLAAMDHCGYCLPHGGSEGLMAHAITGLGLFSGHELRPFLFYRAPQPLLALSAAPPRGPPARA